MRRRTAAGRSQRDDRVGTTVARKAIAVALVTALPPWLVSAVVTDWLFRIGTTGPGSGWLAGSFSWPLVAAPIMAVILDAATVATLWARGRFRSDYWWAAGGLFVINALLAMIVTEVPSSGDFVFLHIMLSMLTGYWILTFTAGALVWRRLTPTYVPLDWVRPPDPDEE